MRDDIDTYSEGTPNPFIEVWSIKVYNEVMSAAKRFNIEPL